jgi:hypothetical protein
MEEKNKSCFNCICQCETFKDLTSDKFPVGFNINKDVPVGIYNTSELLGVIANGCKEFKTDENGRK